MKKEARQAVDVGVQHAMGRAKQDVLHHVINRHA
jgi:hypothetical protein